MRRAPVWIAVSLALAIAVLALAQREASPVPSRFVAYDLIIASGADPIAAYQVEIAPSPGAPTITLVGVEGGGTGPFASAPHYDPVALHAGAFDRIVLAAYLVDAPAPPGEMRVARLHLRVEGDGEPALDLRLLAAGADEFTHITPDIRLAPVADAEGVR